MRCGARAWLFGAASLWAPSAYAAPPEPVRLNYRAAASCPSEGAFFAQMQARSARVRRASPGEDTPTLEIVIAPEGERFVGRFVLRERERASRARRVSAKGCEDVASALALIASLAIDPNADATPAPPGTGLPSPPLAAAPGAGPPSPPPSTAPSAGISSPPPSTAPSAGISSPPPPAPSSVRGAAMVVVPPGRARVTPPSPPPSPSPKARAGRGVASGATSPNAGRPAAAPGGPSALQTAAVAPDTEPPLRVPDAAGSPGARAGRDGATGAKRGERAMATNASAGHAWLIGGAVDALGVGTGTVAPRLGARAGIAWGNGPLLYATASVAPTEARVTEGRIRLLWLTGAATACPLSWRPTASLALAPCAHVEAGALRASGRSVPSPTSTTRPWVAGGALLRLELKVTKRLLVDAQAGLAASFVRDSFYFLPTVEIYRPPAALTWGGIGAWVRFP